jgi:hypothetical protein
MATQHAYPQALPGGHIRLLKVVSDGDNFEGELEMFHKDNLPYFSAISWCWPNRWEVRELTFKCNGQPFPVSPQLDAAICCLTPKGVPSSSRIWIDAICINQDDIEEKNIHIPLMHEVYGKANLVVVWLGVSKDDSDLVIDAQKITTLNQKLALVPAYTSLSDLTHFGLPGPSDAMWRAIGQLCERDWFYRTWVVQEVALAGKVEVCCGSKSLGWTVLAKLIFEIVRIGLAPLCQGPQPAGRRSRPNGFAVLQDLNWVKTMQQNGECAIDYLLHMVRLKEVTKPVDKVYGLMGLTSEIFRASISVDYAEYDHQYWRVYLELGKHIITQDQSFWLLSMASSKERPESLPTWCPNLNSTTPEYLDFGNMTNWRAGFEVGDSRNGRIYTIPGSPNIKIRGFQIDIVRDVIHLGGPSRSNGETDSASDSSGASFQSRESRCFELTQESFGDTDTAVDAHSRTLIANTWFDGSPVLPTQRKKVCQAYNDCKVHLANHSKSNQSGANDGQQLMHQYLTQLDWWSERPFYTTENRRIGRGSYNMKPGDMLCIFYSARPVFILRSDPGSQEAVKLVGDAYLHGCMELESTSDIGRGPTVDFIIG